MALNRMNPRSISESLWAGWKHSCTIEVARRFCGIPLGREGNDNDEGPCRKGLRSARSMLAKTAICHDEEDSGMTHYYQNKVLAL